MCDVEYVTTHPMEAYVTDELNNLILELRTDELLGPGEKYFLFLKRMIFTEKLAFVVGVFRTKIIA